MVDDDDEGPKRIGESETRQEGEPARQGSHVDCGGAGSTGHIATRDNYGCPEGIHSQNGHNFHECYYVSLLFRVAFLPFSKKLFPDAKTRDKLKVEKIIEHLCDKVLKGEPSDWDDFENNAKIREKAIVNMVLKNGGYLCHALSWARCRRTRDKIKLSQLATPPS